MNSFPEQNWAVYEANVQQYRVLSATVQSFLLAVGTILFSSSGNVPKSLLLLVTALGLIHILWIWVPVVRSRHYIIDYYKYQHEKQLPAERRMELGQFCDEKEYAKNAEKRKTVNVEFFGEPELKVWRLTRKKLDWFVPAGYVLVWLSMAVWKIAGIPLW